MPRDSCSNEPVGTGDYVVAAGECISSIAYAHGVFWESLWNHPDNALLREARKDPNALREGDRLTVPDKRLGEVSCATEQRHKFQLKGVPAKLRLRFFEDDEPRKGERYRLFIDGTPLFGELDKNGELEVDIAPDAQQAVLFLGDDLVEHRIQLGSIDPITTWSGIAGRLNNLGYDAGSGEAGMTDELAAALMRFQAAQDLDQTGEADDATRQKIAELHGG